MSAKAPLAAEPFGRLTFLIREHPVFGILFLVSARYGRQLVVDLKNQKEWMEMLDRALRSCSPELRSKVGFDTLRNKFRGAGLWRRCMSESLRGY